jgi:hypothetical protein
MNPPKMEELGAIHEGWAEDGQEGLICPMDFRARVDWLDENHQCYGFREWERGGNL